jgi:cytochrome P450
MERFVTNSSRGPALALNGAASWRWYLHYLRDPLDFFATVQRQYGQMAVLGNPIPFVQTDRRFIVTVGSQINRIVLGRTDVFRPGGQVLRGPRNSAHHRIRQGLFSMYGAHQTADRRMMQPPFAKPMMATYVNAMSRLIDSVIDRWRDLERVDMYEEMRTLSNWVAAHLLFGSDDFRASRRFGEMIEQWLLLDSAARSRLSIINLPGTTFSRLLRKAEDVERMMKAEIARKRDTAAANSDVLSILIDVSNRDPAALPEWRLIAHAVILYAASFETTANALAWTLFLIAQHPGVAAELHDEIDRAMTNWPPDYKALDELPLLDGVIKESMRLLPPVAYTFRTPMQGIEIDGLELGIKDKILLVHYLTHRDPAVFPDANRFDPKRWFAAKPDPYEYVAFSAGPRLCLGVSFAQLELKMTIARVMQRFRLTVAPDARIDAGVQLTLRPLNGLPMIVAPQDRNFTAAKITGNIHRAVDFDERAA